MHQFAETEDNRSGYIVPCLGDSIVNYKKKKS